MSPKSQLFSVAVIAVVAFTAVVAQPKRYHGNSRDSAENGRYAPGQRSDSQRYSAPADYQPGYYPNGQRFSERITYSPKDLRKVNDLLQEILECLSGNEYLRGELDVQRDEIRSLETLVEQLLVSSSAPCKDVKRGVSLDRVESLFEILNSLLQKTNSNSRNNRRDLGAIPHYVNSLVQLLQEIDDSNPAGSGRLGGSNGKGVLLEALNVLDNIFIDQLDNRQAQCSAPSHGVGHGSFYNNQESRGNVRYNGDSEYQGKNKYNARVKQFGETEYDNNTQYHENIGYHNKTGYVANRQYGAKNEYKGQKEYEGENEYDQESEYRGDYEYQA